ncbi:bifunctional riboflavin kinase/FAD synthetase [Filifactor alocis]|nr:bifunctional riboflavin kinase/FAD synthetase [Filifactor alocis]
MSFKSYMNSIAISEETVVTIGNFDGLHRGHLKLMERTLEISKQKNLKSVVFTYENHPLEYVLKKKVEKLFTNRERDAKLKELGIDTILSVPFDEEIMGMSTNDFIQEILIDKLHTKYLVLGEDAHFGKGREGSAECIQSVGSQLGLTVEIIPLFFEDGVRISSSYIRQLIKKGKVDVAKEYLGRMFAITGEVIHGKENGRKLGFPTANISYDEHTVLPALGVYNTIVEYHGKHYIGATSVGYNPTISLLNNRISLEVHILDFEKEIYGEEITVRFISKIRDEMKFNSLEELKNQISKDEILIRKQHDEKY